MPHQQQVADILLGKLVRPINTAWLSHEHKTLFGGAPYGLVTVAEWDPDERFLYLEMLVGEKIMQTNWSALSQFLKFYQVVEPALVE